MIPIYQSFAELQGVSRPIHWAMGFFDGVHRGHRLVMHSASTPGALRGVLTFANHPLSLLRPQMQPLLLTPDPAYKAALIAEEGGADLLLRLPFTPELAALSPTDFFDMLGSFCRIAGVSVGANWHFGRGGAGNAELLKNLGAQRGFTVCINELALADDAPVSSDRIRRELATGQMERVADMLGRPFTITGSVTTGQRLARQLGFPTANIPLQSGAALPPFGVYAVRCSVDKAALIGIANLGLRPTVSHSASAPLLELHLPGWQGDLYGHHLEVKLLHFLRPEQQFASLDELSSQIRADIAALASLPCA